MDIKINEKEQAVAPKTIKMDNKAFEKTKQTSIYWMGNASMMINSRGTNIMIDPLLITHTDNDHFSRSTCEDVKGVCQSYHGPHYVAHQMKEEINIDGIGHDIYESFMINDIKVTLTPAWHNWQNEYSKYNYREWKKEDYCGYLFDTVDGIVWLPGDSRLLEEHLNMNEPDVILFDFSDNPWHITIDGAIKLANTYPNSDLICIHWGSVDAPTMSPFNGNPESLIDKIINPERIKVLAPGEQYILRGKKL